MAGEERGLTPGELAAIRYRALARGIGEEWFGGKYGWLSKTARRLGVSPSYVKRIVDGDRKSVGMDAVDHAIRGVPVRREYFTDPGDLDWRDYVQPTHAGELIGHRYRRLAEGLGEICGAPAHGWKSEVARRLGIDLPYLNRVLGSESPSVGLKQVERAVRGMPIAWEYFTTPPKEDGSEPDWRDYTSLRAKSLSLTIEANAHGVVSTLEIDGNRVRVRTESAGTPLEVRRVVSRATTALIELLQHDASSAESASGAVKEVSGG